MVFDFFGENDRVIIRIIIFNEEGEFGGNNVLRDNNMEMLNEIEKLNILEKLIEEKIRGL